MMNKAIAKYRKEGCLGEWFLTDFTMEQVEGRIENLEEEVKRLREEIERLQKLVGDHVRRRAAELWLSGEVKRLRSEIDKRYLCPECGYNWDERPEGRWENEI